jgi:hypothetical protein
MPTSRRCSTGTRLRSSKQNEVGHLADFEAAFEPFLKRRKGTIEGVHADGCGQVHVLVGTADIPDDRPTRQPLLDAKQRGIVPHRGIGAPRHRHPGGDQAFDWEHRVGTVATVVLEVAFAKLPEERRLDGRHDVLDAHAVAQIGRADGTVLNAVADPVPRELPLGTGQGIQGLLDGPVADGVHRALETLPVGTC